MKEFDSKKAYNFLYVEGDKPQLFQLIADNSKSAGYFSSVYFPVLEKVKPIKYDLSGCHTPWHATRMIEEQTIANWGCSDVLMSEMSSLDTKDVQRDVLTKFETTGIVSEDLLKHMLSKFDKLKAKLVIVSDGQVLIYQSQYNSETNETEVKSETYDLISFNMRLISDIIDSTCTRSGVIVADSIYEALKSKYTNTCVVKVKSASFDKSVEDLLEYVDGHSKNENIRNYH